MLMLNAVGCQQRTNTEDGRIRMTCEETSQCSRPFIGSPALSIREPRLLHSSQETGHVKLIAHL